MLILLGAFVLLIAYDGFGGNSHTGRSTTTRARTIRAAVQNSQSTTSFPTCPTMEQLVNEKHLDPNASTSDEWGHPFELRCVEDEVYVTSLGSDEKRGTMDDIQVPKAALAQPGAGIPAVR
jgi:hypothetical protein